MRKYRRALLRGGRRYVCAYGCARAWATLTFTGASGAGVLGAPSKRLRFSPHVRHRFHCRQAFSRGAAVPASGAPERESRGEGGLLRLYGGCIAAVRGDCLDPGGVLGAHGRGIAGGGRGLWSLPAAGRGSAGHLQSVAHLPVPVGRDASRLGHHVLLRGACRPSGPGHARAFASAGDAVPAGRLRACACRPIVPSGACRSSPTRGSCSCCTACTPSPTACGRTGSVAGAGRHSSASTFILMAVLFVTAYFASKRFNIGLLYRSPVVLMVCGFLLVPAEESVRHGGVQLPHRHQLLAHVLPRDVPAVRHRQALGCGYRGVHGHQEERRAVAAAGWWRRHRCAGHARAARRPPRLWR